MSSTQNTWYFNLKESCGAQAEQTPVLSGAYTCSVYMDGLTGFWEADTHSPQAQSGMCNCLTSPVLGAQTLTAIP